MIVDPKINKQIVGVYLIDGKIEGTQLATTIKPSLIKRLLVSWIFGWKWITVEKLKTNK